MKKFIDVGHTAPDFEALALYNNKPVTVRLSRFWGKQHVVLLFYSGDFNSKSSKAVRALSFDSARCMMLGLNVLFLAISTDSLVCHYIWSQTSLYERGSSFRLITLVSDFSKEISKNYKVLTPQGETLPSLFILDKQMKIQYYIAKYKDSSLDLTYFFDTLIKIVNQ